MKTLTPSLTLMLLMLATSAIYSGEPARGVAGVDVIAKQNPSKRTVTDARGNFALDGLAPGSYMLTFRSRKAQDIKMTSTTKVTIASSYSIKIDGTKRSVNQSGLTSDKLIAGVDVSINVAAGAKIRGQVSAGAIKKMVWIPAEPGSHIPGHWAEASSAEAKARRNDTQTLSSEELVNVMNRGNPNMTDPKDPRNAPGTLPQGPR